VTLIIGVSCKNGIVIGGDRLVVKIRATELKSFEHKLVTYTFGDGRPIIIGSAGVGQDAKRAIREIDPKAYGLRESAELTEYLEIVVEPKLSTFYIRLRDARGRPPEYSLTVGCIDPDGVPALATVYSDGSFDLEPLSTMGAGAPFAELILRDISLEDMTVDVARFLIGYIISKVSLVHHDVDGITNGMDVLAIKNEKPKELIQLSDDDFSKILDLLRNVTFADLSERIREALGNSSKK